jgi:capsular exopolysaccharide synthesis family protein
MTGGYLYLRYSTPIYEARASIIINEENSKNAGPELSGYADLTMLTNLATKSIENEIAILRSRQLMDKVVTALDLHIQYFQWNNVRDEEIYEDLPFSFNVLNLNEEELKELGGAKFKVVSDGKENLKILNVESDRTIKTVWGAPIDLGFANVVIRKIPGKNGNLNETTIIFAIPEKVASHYRKKIILNQIDRNSNVIELVLQDPVQKKAQDIIDQLILEFNRDAIDGKNLIAGNTANFINERLNIINDELEIVETGKEEFKENNRLTDIQAESQMFIENASEYNKRRQEVGTQMELANAMLEYLSSSLESELLPANLGIEEGGVNMLIGEYNNLVLERNRILGGSTEKNPVIIKLNNRIDQIKANVFQSLKRMRTNLEIAQADLDRQSSSIGSKILAVPSQERQYRGIERQQSIKEVLYLFLLQKREENSLALAVTAPKAKIVDRAYSTGEIISPSFRRVVLGSFALGLFIPFSLIYVKNLLNNKVRSKSDVENLAKEIPFVGELPRVKKKKDFLIGVNDRSMLSESFRILITNLQYLLVHSTDKKKATKILVTSTVKGEGKTFTTVNLGITLANTGKRVLLIGADLRNPQLESFKEKNSQKLGVSDYLKNDQLYVDDLIADSRLHVNLKILGSGSIPPNPSELLRLEKVAVMLDKLEDYYDYLIIDSAPSMLVTDTFLINKYAHLTLYVVRADYTEKKLIKFAVDANESGAISHLSFVLNNVSASNLGYGNKYGYGYGERKKSIWANRELDFGYKLF